MNTTIRGRVRVTNGQSRVCGACGRETALGNVFGILEIQFNETMEKIAVCEDCLYLSREELSDRLEQRASAFRERARVYGTLAKEGLPPGMQPKPTEPALVL